MSRLIDLATFVDGQNSTLPKLPVVHVTDGYQLEQMLATGAPQALSLDPEYCEFMKEPFVYLFYGRPDYRTQPAEEIEIGVRSHFLNPTAFVLKPQPFWDIAESDCEVFPFDTGAFLSGRYKGFFDKKMCVHDFRLAATSQTPAKTVSAFYSDNEGYYRSRPNRVRPKHAKSHLDQYAAMIAGEQCSQTDSRKSAIEIQVRISVPLNRETLLAVVAPDNIIENGLTNVATKLFGVPPTTYFASDNVPAHSHTATLYDRVFQIYRQEHLI